MSNVDFIKDLGYMAVASRLKRLTDRFFRGGNEIYRTLGLDFEPRWFALFYFLYAENAPRTIMAAAEALRISHPAVIQTARGLVQKGLAESFQDGSDRRKRHLVITDLGRKKARDLLPVWDSFTGAVEDLMDRSRVDLLSCLERLESSLDEEGLPDRILRRIKERQSAAVEILSFSPDLAPVFKSLNEEWLAAEFRVEDADARILNHPRKEIIAKGGTLLFARLDGEIAGTAAVLKIDDATYELAKMAVAEKFRGRQAGRKLAEAAVAWARARGGHRVVLRTHRKQKAALGLYEKMGFRPVAEPDRLPRLHEREKTGIMMSLDLRSADYRESHD